MKTSLLNITLDNFLDGIYKLEQNSKPIFKLVELEITKDNLEEIKKAIDTRNQVNQARGVMEITEFKRPPSSAVDEKGMTAEVMFTKVMQTMYENTRSELLDWKIETPPVAEMVLDKSKQDFVIENKQEYVTFDVKGQFSTAKTFNINGKAMRRMKKQSQFFIAGITECFSNNLNTAKKIKFYYVDLDHFLKTAQEKFNPSNGTTYYSIDLSEINI